MMTNVILLALMSFIEALQVLIIVALIGSFIPIPISSFAEHLYSLSLYDVRPEREMFFYRLWVLMAIALQAVFVFCFRAELSSNTLRKKLYPFAAVSGFWVLLQVFAAFKVFLWGNPPWARGLLYMGIAGGMASTIFWPELQRFGKNVFERFQQDTRLQRSPLWDLGFLIGLMVLLVPGNLGNVLGRMFVRDQFYHLDSILMAPGWAHLNGLGLNTDITSEYSVALPIILSEILKHSIGFDYPSAVVLIMAIVFMYYIALYFFARQWLMSRALAIFAVLLTVKLQMFHWGVAPLVWQFPSATALRHWPDIVFFVCVWRHIQTSKQQWLWAAATAVGFSLAWMMDVGMYMLCALLVYTVAWAYQQRRGTGYLLKILAIMFAAPCATAFFLWTLLQPQAVFQAAYWRNAFEFAGLFVQGWGALPMTEGLKDKQFFAFIMGFIIPVIYAWTLIYVGSLCLLRKIRFDHIFVVVLCVYGLGLYHYFIHRSGVTSYDAVCVPLVLVLCFWVQYICAMMPARFKSIIPIGLALWTFVALATGYLFTYYPNVLNLGGLNWTPERAFYQKEFNFTQDGTLVRNLTKPGEGAALISSFETKILMQANRRPFFYYFPLMESSLMDAPDVRGTYLHTQERVAKTLGQLQRQKPPYIFVETKLLGIAAQPSLKVLLDYVAAQYNSSGQSTHLTVYRRKD